MKKVYFINDAGALASKEVADDYVLQDDELPAQGQQMAAVSTTQQLSQLALQQAQFQASQQKLDAQLALQLAQLTAKEVQNV